MTRLTIPSSTKNFQSRFTRIFSEKFYIAHVIPFYLVGQNSSGIGDVNVNPACLTHCAVKGGEFFVESSVAHPKQFNTISCSFDRSMIFKLGGQVRETFTKTIDHIMGEHRSDRQTIRFLSFANDTEDTEKDAKLKAAAAKIEQAIAKEKALNELIDCPQASSLEEAINPEHDVRSLYERLQEQKNKKQEVMDETKKLSNYVAHLDEDDANYLNEVAKNRREEELRKRLAIQDALEAKKRLDEQKMLDEEKRRRESLLGGTTRDSRKSRSLLHSMIKKKSRPNPKSEPETKSEKDGSSTCTDPMSSSSSKRPNDEDEKDNAHTQKKLFPLDKVDKKGISTTKDLNDRLKSGKYCEAHSCECPKDVAKVLGVLPSSLIVSQDPKDSEDSDYSDDDLNCRLIPKSRTKRR